MNNFPVEISKILLHIFNISIKFCLIHSKCKDFYFNSKILEAIFNLRKENFNEIKALYDFIYLLIIDDSIICNDIYNEIYKLFKIKNPIEVKEFSNDKAISLLFEKNKFLFDKIFNSFCYVEKNDEKNDFVYFKDDRNYFF